jgi:DNA-directed RNA polymerase subunit RPC12/RpoP
MADDIPVVICGEAGYFFDDLPAKCARCGKGIVHRPHVPEPSEKICTECGLKFLALREEEVKLQITEETLEELKDYFEGKKH